MVNNLITTKYQVKFVLCTKLIFYVWIATEKAHVLLDTKYVSNSKYNILLY